MAFKKHDIKDYRAILLLVVTILPVIASTNINCHGRPFHCVNSTHFMICVDIGGGYSSTIDNLVIPCPPTTICLHHNRFECEFPSATPAPTHEMLQASTTSIGIASTTVIQNVTTAPSAQTTDTLNYGNLNSLNPTINIQAIENVTGKPNITERSIAASTANTSQYPNTANVQLTSPTPKENTTKENRIIADTVYTFTTVGSFIIGVGSNTTLVNNTPSDKIKFEITTDQAATVVNTQKANNNGSNNNTKNVSSTFAFTQDFSNTTQEITTPGSNTNFAKEPLTTNLATEIPVFSISQLQSTTENATSTAETQKNKDGKGISTNIQDSSSLTILNTNKPTSPTPEPMLTGLQSTTSSTVGLRFASTQNKLTPSDVSTDTPMVPVSTVADKYSTSINSVSTADSSNYITIGNAFSSTNSAIKSSNITAFNEPLTTNTVTITNPAITNKSSDSHKNKESKRVESTTQGSLIFTDKTKTSVTELDKTGPLSSTSPRVDIGSYAQSTLTTSPVSTDSTIGSIGTVTEIYPNSVHSIVNTSSINIAIGNETSASNVDVTTEKILSNHTSKKIDASTKRPVLNVGTDGTLSPRIVIHKGTDNHFTDVTTESITVKGQYFSTALQDNATTVSYAHTFNIPLKNVSTDSTIASVGIVTEIYPNSVGTLINTSSTDIAIANNTSSSIVDSTAEKLYSNNKLKSTEAFTKRPLLNIGTEGSLSSQNVIHNTTDINLIYVTTESIAVKGQNVSSALQDNATTTSNAHTFDVQLTTVSTDSTMSSIGTVTEIYPNSVHPLINASSTNNAIASSTSSSTVDSTPEKLHSHKTSKSTEAFTKQPLSNVGIDGSISSHYVINNNTDSNLIKVTTESIKDVSSALQKIATTSTVVHTFVPLTTKNVTNMMTFPVSTDSTTASIGTVTEIYPTPVNSINKASAANNAIASSTSSSTVDSTTEKSYSHNTTKSTEVSTKQPPFNIGTEGRLHNVIHNTTDSNFIAVTTESITVGVQNFSSALTANSTTTSDAHTVNVPLTTKMVTKTSLGSTESTMASVGTVTEIYPNSAHPLINASSSYSIIASNTSTSTVDPTGEILHINNTSKSTEAFTKQPVLIVGADGSLSSQHVIHHTTDSNFIDVTTGSIIGNSQNLASALQENTTPSNTYTSNVSLTTKMVINSMTSPISTDSTTASVSTVTEIFQNSVYPIINASSTNNTVSSDKSSSTVDSTTEKLHGNNTSKSTEVYTKQPVLNIGIEASLHNVTHNTTDNIFIDVTTESISVNGQNFSTALQENSATTTDAHTVNVPLTTKLVIKTSPVSTDSTTISVGTVTEIYPNSVNSIINASATNNAIPNNPPLSIAGKLQSNDTSKSTEAYTKQPLLNVGTEASLSSHYVIHNSTDSLFVDVATESVTVSSQNLSSALQENTTSFGTQTYNVPLTTKMFTNLMSSPVSTDSTTASVGTVTEIYPNSVYPLMNASSTYTTVASDTSSSTVELTGVTYDTTLRTNASTKNPLIDTVTEGNLTSHHKNNGNVIDVTTEYTSPIPVSGQRVFDGLQKTATTSSYTNTYTGGSISTKIVAELTTLPVSTDSHLASMNTPTEKYLTPGHSVINATSSNNTIASNKSSTIMDSTTSYTQSPILDVGTEGLRGTNLDTGPILTSSKPNTASVVDIGLIPTQNKQTTSPVSTRSPMSLVSTVTEKYTTSIPVVTNEHSINITFASTKSSVMDSTDKKLNNSDTQQSTKAPSKQSFDIGTEKSLSTQHLDRNNTSGHFIAVTTESMLINGQSTANVIQEAATTSYNANNMAGLHTTDKNWKGVDSTVHESTTFSISILNTGKPTSLETRPIIISSEPSISSAVDMGLVSTQSDLTTSPISTDNLITSMSTEKYSTALNTVKNANSTNSTNASTTPWTSSATTEVSTANITTNIFKTTQTGAITIGAKQQDVGTERGWTAQDTINNIVGHTINATTENILAIPIGGLISSSINTTTTVSDLNRFSGTFSENLVTAPTTDAGNTISDTLGTQSPNETFSTIQEKSMINITNTVKPTSSVTQLVMTGYTQPSTSSVKSVESVSEQSNLTASSVSTGSGVSSYDKVSQTTETYIKTQDMGTGKNISASSYAIYNNSENTSTTLAFSNKLHDIASTTISHLTTGITRAPTTPLVNSSTDIKVNQNWVETVTPIQKGSTFNSSEVAKSITTPIESTVTVNSQSTIYTEGQNITYSLLDTAGTRFYTNTIDASLTTNAVTEPYKDTSNRNTDALANQNNKSVGTNSQKTTAANILDNFKTSSSVTEQIPSNSSMLTTVAVEGLTSPVTADSTSFQFNISASATTVNNKIFNNTQVTSKQPNGTTRNSLATSNTAGESTRVIITSHSQYDSNKLSHTTPSSYSNTFIDSHTTDMSSVTTMSDTQVSHIWDTTVQGYSISNSSDAVQFRSPVTVVTLIENPQSSTSGIPTEIPISTDYTTLSLNKVTENYSTLSHINISANASNNAVGSQTSATIPDLINKNTKNNNILKTTQAYTKNLTVTIESLSSHTTTDVISSNAMNIHSGNISTTQNSFQNTLPVQATTSTYSNHANVPLTTKNVAGGITDTSSISTDKLDNRNWDGVLPTVENSSSLNSSDSIQTARSTTVVTMTGDPQSSTSANKKVISTSPVTLPISTTEKYLAAITFDTGVNIINNTSPEKSATTVEKSNSTSLTTQSRNLPDVKTENGLTSYSTNSTTQGIKDSTFLPSEKLSSEGSGASTASTTFIYNGIATKPILNLSTNNIINNFSSNLISVQTTPMPLGVNDTNVSTIQANSSLHFGKNVTTAHINNTHTTELVITKTAGNRIIKNSTAITSSVTEKTMSTKQSNLENSADSFPGNHSNSFIDISNLPNSAANILSSTKTYHTDSSTKTTDPLYSSYDSYLTPVTESQIQMLTTLINRQTTEGRSIVGNVAATTTVSNDIPDQSHNTKIPSNLNNISSGSSHVNSGHDISSHQHKTIETKSNRTVNNRAQIENQSVTSEHRRKQTLHIVHEPNTLTSRNPQTVNANNGIFNKILNFQCPHHRRGRYADNDDCRKFYICIGNQQPILGVCPVNTVFSEINKQCTKNLSHCIRNNQFQCTSEGRFGDYLKDSVYYICVKNGAHAFVRYKLQCQNGYYLNKTEVRCMRTIDSTSESKSVSSDSSKRSSDSTNTKSQESVESVGNYEGFRCENEGKFADPNDCRIYYVCSKRSKSGFRLKKKKCDSDEVFHKDKKKCVTAESDEC